MNRRDLLTRLSLSSGGLLLSSCGGVGLGPGLTPSYLIRPEMMMAKLLPYFPLTRSYQGLAQIGFANPVLSMVPETDKVRVGLTTSAAFAGLGQLQAGQTSGRCQLACGLRYDPETRGIFLKDTTLEDLSLNGVSNNWIGGIKQIANGLGSQILEKHPVHTLDPGLGSSLLKSMKVTPQGLRLGFGL